MIGMMVNMISQKCLLFVKNHCNITYEEISKKKRQEILDATKI